MLSFAFSFFKSFSVSRQPKSSHQERQRQSLDRQAWERRSSRVIDLL